MVYDLQLTKSSTVFLHSAAVIVALLQFIKTTVRVQFFGEQTKRKKNCKLMEIIDFLYPYFIREAIDRGLVGSIAYYVKGCIGQ